MKKSITSALFMVLVGVSAYAGAPGDTTQVSGFTLEEQSLNLRIGESYQLHVNPSNSNVRWMASYSLVDNPVSMVDDNGMVTAFRSGSNYITVESQDGSIIKQCLINVANEGSIKKDSKLFAPTNECEWTDASFTLSNDGKFTASGSFFGSGANYNTLNYTVTDQCIYISFSINYEDSTKTFYPQPFSLEVSGCNAQEYVIYYNNQAQRVESQGQYARYALKRGSSAGTTKAETVPVKKDESLIIGLDGRILESVPPKGYYIRNGAVYYNLQE